MNRFIFINLLIDRFWARGSVMDKIFNSTNPQSLRLSLVSFNLSINYQDTFSNVESDLYFLTQDVDAYWRNTFARFHHLDQLRTVTLRDDPYSDSQWLSRLEENMFGCRLKNFIFSGISEIEQAIVDRLSFNKMDLNQKMLQQKNLNSKALLLDVAKSESVSIPKSEKIIGQDLDFISDDYKDKLFKFNISSGGGGQFDLKKLQILANWAESRGLISDWNQSVWLCQNRIDVIKEWSLFSHTLGDSYQIAEVFYDQNHLSNLHVFNKIDYQSNVFQEYHDKIKKFLLKNGYHGFFGFDLIQSSDREFYLIDLNVRLTKTHLLAMGIDKWGNENGIVAFYRKRFFLKDSISFECFWIKFCQAFEQSIQGEGLLGRVLPFDIFGYSVGQSEITFLIDVSLKETVEAFVVKIDKVIKVMDL